MNPFDEFDTTEAQLDRYMADGEPARIVERPTNLSGNTVRDCRIDPDNAYCGFTLGS